MSQRPTDVARRRMHVLPLVAVMAAALVLGFGSAATAAPLVGTTTRISVDSAGTQGDGDSGSSAISSEGRFITYASDATNLVVGDTNGSYDVFLSDTTTSSTTRISGGSGPTESNGRSEGPAISSDGRYIAYTSDASNLVVGDTNGTGDVFLFDTTTSTSTRISGGTGPAESNGTSYNSAISGDGRYITYESPASNLVVGDTNGTIDVFLFDTTTSVTARVSGGTGPTESNGNSFDPAISDDGRFVTYASDASNIVVDDTNGDGDVFVFNTTISVTTRVSVDSDANQGNGNSFDAAISDDGRYIAYISLASNLVVDDTNGLIDVFLFDRTTITTTRISVDSATTQSNGNSFEPAISGDGHYVTYNSGASNLVVGDTNGVGDVFLFDRIIATTNRISVDSSGAESDDESFDSMISGDGRYVTYRSDATNLVVGDTNGTEDVFLAELSDAPALAATGTDPSAPIAVAAFVLGVGVLAVTYYRRQRAW